MWSPHFHPPEISQKEPYMPFSNRFLSFRFLLLFVYFCLPRRLIECDLYQTILSSISVHSEYSTLCVLTIRHHVWLMHCSHGLALLAGDKQTANYLIYLINLCFTDHIKCPTGGQWNLMNVVKRQKYSPWQLCPCAWSPKWRGRSEVSCIASICCQGFSVSWSWGLSWPVPIQRSLSTLPEPPVNRIQAFHRQSCNLLCTGTYLILY